MITKYHKSIINFFNRTFKKSDKHNLNDTDDENQTYQSPSKVYSSCSFLPLVESVAFKVSEEYNSSGDTPTFEKHGSKSSTSSPKIINNVKISTLLTENKDVDLMYSSNSTSQNEGLEIDMCTGSTTFTQYKSEFSFSSINDKTSSIFPNLLTSQSNPYTKI